MLFPQNLLAPGLQEKPRRAAGASEDEADKACQVADEALRYKARERQPVERWTADDVEAYLLDYYPGHGGAPDEELELVPLHLDALLEWLAASGRGEPGPFRTARARIARCRDAFLRDARDPKLFGLAKTVVRAMQREGIDPSDRRATDRFMADFNERLRQDPSLLPTPEDSRRHRKLWVCTPGQPATGPGAPCPCGSAPLLPIASTPSSPGCRNTKPCTPVRYSARVQFRAAAERKPAGFFNMVMRSSWRLSASGACATPLRRLEPPMNTKPLVAGVGMTRFYKPSESPTWDVLGVAAVRAALKDAGIPFAHVQQAFAGYVFANTTSASWGS